MKRTIIAEVLWQVLSCVCLSTDDTRDWMRCHVLVQSMAHNRLSVPDAPQWFHNNILAIKSSLELWVMALLRLIISELSRWECACVCVCVDLCSVYWAAEPEMTCSVCSFVKRHWDRFPYCAHCTAAAKFLYWHLFAGIRGRPNEFEWRLPLKEFWAEIKRLKALMLSAILLEIR